MPGMHVRMWYNSWIYTSLHSRATSHKNVSKLPNRNSLFLNLLDSVKRVLPLVVGSKHPAIAIVCWDNICQSQQTQNCQLSENWCMFLRLERVRVPNTNRTLNSLRCLKPCSAREQQSHPPWYQHKRGCSQAYFHPSKFLLQFFLNFALN